jgi:2-(1,2-epoxy-1,2-dihydrophenyl)acetyl-CoA isomerase
MSTPATDAAVLRDTRSGVLLLTLNRPDVLNAITPPLLDGLTAALQDCEQDDSLRAVVITGAGRGFCSGQDLKAAAADGDVDIERTLREHYHPVLNAMRGLEKPVIAAVNGVAAGAGFSLALAADLRLAAESASFVQAFVRVGLIPDAGSTYFLPRLVGPAKAAELMMLGETVRAAEALQLGIVSQVVPDAMLLDTAMDVARRLAAGPRSLGLIKRALNASSSNDLEAQLRVEERLQAEAARSEDFLEGIGAFLQKRSASFSGR